MMSGVLLSVAFYGVLRVKTIGDAALGQTFLRTLLLVIALTTLALAATLLVGQRDYKRMLAYSSMEHMGLIAVGAAVGSQLAVAALLLHMAGHGLAKAVAFLSSGHILHRYRSSTIAVIRGLGVTSPGLAAAFGLAVVALLGFPPAAVFASELGIAKAGAAAGLSWAVAVAFGLALLAFAPIAVATGRMLLGPPRATDPLNTPDHPGAPAPYAMDPYAMDPYAMDPYAMDPYAMDPYAMDPYAAFGSRDVQPGQRPLGFWAGIPLAAGLLAVVALGLGSGPLLTVLRAAASVVSAS
jgi:hydrogenase-4 component F